MSKGKIAYFLYQKDFSEKGDDRYFLLDDGFFKEVKAEYLVNLDFFLVTHDYWLISSSIYKGTGRLPKNIIDVTLLGKIVSGKKANKRGDQSWDIMNSMKDLFGDPKDIKSYMDMYYRRSEIDMDIYMLFAHKLTDHFERLSNESYKLGESSRFYSLELPIFNKLTSASNKGIRVDNETVRKHKENLKYDFYRELKVFAEKHDVMYELPTDGYIIDKLKALGYQTEDFSIEFMLNFLQSKDGYTDDLRSLQKTYKSYRVFNSISSSSTRLYPMVESHWTSTSRIYHKSPSIQNISKKYRDIFIPDEGKSLCYIDYDQFEVGVMAHMSSDKKLADIYNNSDAYENLALRVFGDSKMRKKAKILFLSFTYGMSIENILRAVKEIGGNTQEANSYFANFKEFESWKTSIWDAFSKHGKVSTINGNHLKRSSDGELTSKEKRSSVNHVIQGTATYIFKLALLELSENSDLDILIPMHDAVLIQHTDNVRPEDIRLTFERIMSETLPSIAGKASLEAFFVPE